MKSRKMKAVIVTKYGSPEVLKIEEVEKPTPKSDEVLVKINATPVTAADGMMRKGTPFYARFFLGLRRPKNPIPGTGFAGEIVAIGEQAVLGGGDLEACIDIRLGDGNTAKKESAVGGEARDLYGVGGVGLVGVGDRDG